VETATQLPAVPVSTAIQEVRGRFQVVAQVPAVTAPVSQVVAGVTPVLQSQSW